MEPKLRNLFIVEVVPVMCPPYAGILLLEAVEHGERHRIVFPHSRIRITDFKYSGLLVITD